MGRDRPATRTVIVPAAVHATKPDAQLDEIRALTGAMLEAARAAEWAAVANLEAARAVLLRAAFEGDGRAAPDRLAELARELLERDRELIELGERARAAVGAELTRLRRHGRACHAYTETGAER